jgi:phosphatidylglycerophosphate synthase
MAVVVLAAFATNGSRSFPHARIGSCNAVTYFRGSLACVLVAPLAAPQAMADPALGWSIFAIGCLALSLDGIDGHLARREGTASAFGARFDLEVDSLLALVLAGLALAGGAAGPAVLVLGLARYTFWAAGFVWPRLARPLPGRLSRKAVCVVQLSALIALQAPILPSRLGDVIAVGAAALLVWSFCRDARWLALQPQ